MTDVGAGLGREYAKFFASRGTKVMVNDLEGTFDGAGGKENYSVEKGSSTHLIPSGCRSSRQRVCQSWRNRRTKFHSVKFGDRIIGTAFKSFRRIYVHNNNAAILIDASLKNMQDKDWDVIMNVHLTGSYKVISFPQLLKNCP